MHLSLALAGLALAASVFLLLHLKTRPLPIVAVTVSGVELLRVLGILHVEIRGMPLNLLLGAALAAVAVVILVRVQAKWAVSASTCLAFVGAIELLMSLR